VRSTQFHELAARVAGSAERDGVAMIAPLLVQPIAPSEVGEVLLPGPNVRIAPTTFEDWLAAGAE
jgi:hypothetical protein